MIDENTKVLIVDDLHTMRKITRGMLSQLEIKNIHEAESGSVALIKIKQTHFDVILLDWNMPNMSGLEVLKEIRLDPTTKNIPVIMVTAEKESDNILAAVQSGAKDYIIKPFTINTLEAKLKLVLSS